MVFLGLFIAFFRMLGDSLGLIYFEKRYAARDSVIMKF